MSGLQVVLTITEPTLVKRLDVFVPQNPSSGLSSENNSSCFVMVVVFLYPLVITLLEFVVKLIHLTPVLSKKIVTFLMYSSLALSRVMEVEQLVALPILEMFCPLVDLSKSLGS